MIEMKPEQLEEIAWALDALSKLARVVLEPLAALDSMNASTAEVTVNLTRHGEPLSSEDARKLLEWIDGDAMQRDIRALAAEIVIDRDAASETITLIAKLIGGLAVPVSLGMGRDGLLGAAYEPWLKLYERFGGGWASPEDIERRLREVL